MEKIELYKKRNLGEVIATTFDFFRQNFKLISKCYLTFVLPFVLVSIFIMIGHFISANHSDQNKSNVNLHTFFIGLISLFSTLYWEATVLNELVIAYEQSEEVERLEIANVTTLIKKDLLLISGSIVGLLILGVIISLLTGLLSLFSILILVAIGYESYFETILILVFCTISFYILICMSSFFMLLLKDEYDVLSASMKSITMTFGKWRWLKTFSTFAILLLITGVFYSFSFSPFYLLIYLFDAHNISLSFIEANTYRHAILYTGFAASSIIFSYSYHLVLVGASINYYSLIEEKEHVGLLTNISNIGVITNNIKLKEGEY